MIAHALPSTSRFSFNIMSYPKSFPHIESFWIASSVHLHDNIYSMAKRIGVPLRPPSHLSRLFQVWSFLVGADAGIMSFSFLFLFVDVK